MSRKRICEDCGNKCNDEYCPICGRKTKVYNEASRQEDTLYDAAKYRTTADTKKAESGVFEEKKERIDDSERVREHRYNHPNAKNLRLRMEKGGHPYYEHIKGGGEQKNIRLVQLFSLLLIIGIVVAVAVVAMTSFRDEPSAFTDNEDIGDSFVSGNISKHEVEEKVSLTCMVKDYEYAEGVQTVIVENNSPYFVKTDLIKNGEPVGYLNLPSHSKTENLIYDENLSSCENKIYGVYEMDIEKPQVAYTFTDTYVEDYTLQARIDVKEAIDEKQLAVLMRYLYAQASESFLYELYEVNIYQGNRYLFDSYFDFTRGTIKFNSVEASFTMEDIVIEN